SKRDWSSDVCSSDLVLRLLEEGRQVDEIIFCDTGLEFPQMYDHLEKLERYISRPITRLKAPYTFEQYFYEYQAKTDATLLTNRGLSWPAHACRWCTDRLKTHVIAKHLREVKKQYHLIQYVGIVADEAHRCKDLHYPLVEWGMTLADRSEEHTSELQSRFDLVCRLLLDKKNTKGAKDVKDA